MDFSAFLQRPAGALLDNFGVSMADVTFHDEPPAKLRGIRFSIGEPPNEQEIWVGLAYTRELFSLARKWSEEAIRRATVNYASEKPWWSPG